MSRLVALSFVLCAFTWAVDSKMEQKQFWCEQNWQKYRELKLSEFKIRQKHISEERRCVENSEIYQEMRNCMLNVREEMRRELSQLRKILLKVSTSQL